MAEIHLGLAGASNDAVAGFTEVAAKDRSLNLPSVGNAAERCDAFAQKMGHAIDTLRGT
jgi:hypothetical protein